MSRLRGLLAFQFALLAIGAVAASSAQADGYVSVKDRYVAPTWTGCYVGYDDGYKWGRTRFSTPPTYTLNNPTATVATPSTDGDRAFAHQRFPPWWAIRLQLSDQA